MSETARLDTHQKALRINLDGSIFGSFAEIGAGQEVARWFLRVGGASGTVAKTISAYDKAVSDDLYGAGTRYVSRPRLEAMLDREWAQLSDEVAANRGRESRLFAFADTVAARNFEGTNDANGWMGVSFQDRPGGETSRMLLHVNMRDKSCVAQQEALGILGVNLLYALYFERQSVEQFLKALFADIEEERLEIDLVDFSGESFKAWDQRKVLVRLVTSGMAEAVAFTPEGVALPPSELLYKAPVLLAPGTFEHISPINKRILSAGVKELKAELAVRTDESAAKDAPRLIGVFCVSAESLGEGSHETPAEELEARIDRLLGFGSPVVLVRRREYYHVTALISRYTKEPVRFAIGVSVLYRMFADASYEQLQGRILEGIARLFSANVRFYVCSMESNALKEQLEVLVREGWDIRVIDGRVAADTSRPPSPRGHLYDYLLTSGFVTSIRGPEN